MAGRTGRIPVEIEEISQLLSKGLSFDRNFRGFIWSGEIEAGVTLRISHDLGVIPTRFVLLFPRGTVNLVQGETQKPTSKFFYIRNMALASTFNGSVLILP